MADTATRPPDATSRDETFADFVRDAQDPVRHALTAGFGVEIGREAAEEALIYAWQHWDRVRGMDNRRGYVYRVGHHIGQKMARRSRRRVAFPAPPPNPEPGWVEPGLPAALSRLSPRQRAVVVLVHGYELSQREAARLLGISAGSVQRHLERGLAHLRTDLGVTDRD